MVISGPSYIPIVKTENVADMFSAFENISNVVGGVGVFGSAAAYALVWELGSRRLKSPGPKTLWSTNRDGERAILTRQAPRGYIGIFQNQFWLIAKEEIAKIEFKASDSARETSLRLQVAVDNANQRIAALIASRAPVDSGALRSQIQMIDSDSSELLESSNAESSSIFVL